MTTDADDANSLPTDTPPADDAPPQDAPAADDAPADPPADGADGDDPEGGTEPQHVPYSRFSEVVSERKAYKEYAELAERQTAAWREKALELMRATGQAPDPKPAEPKAAPKLDDFDSTEQWAAAYQQYVDETTTERARAAAREALEHDRQTQSTEQLRSQWQSRLSEFAAKRPDAQAVISNPSLPITPTMSEVITASEHGPQMAYHLGTHPAEAAEIAKMSPARQAAALGRLEAKLSSTPAASPKPPARKPSNAPEPPSPIDGGGTPSVDLESCSLNEFLERRLGKRKRA